MPNAVYESLVSRLAVQAPLIAKGLVNAALSRRGWNAETVTPFQLRELLEIELLPKIARIIHGHPNFAGLGIGRIQTDATGRVDQVDPLLRGLLPEVDLTLDEGLGKRLLDAGILLAPDAPEWEGVAVAVRTQTRGSHTLRLINFYVQQRGQMVLVQDITLEAALEREAAQLHAELQAANERLTQTQAQLVRQETLASLGGLVAGIAHEINTPLGISLTAATHLAQELATLKQSLAAGQLKRSALESFLNESAESLNLIQANLERAAQLVRSFKMVSADQTSQEMRRFDLAEYLEDILRSLGPKLRKTRIAVRLACPSGILMYGPAGALAQVLTNLVTNALTHAFAPDQDGQIEISVQRLDEAHVRLEFADNGRGMNAEERQMAFRPFYTTRRDAGGTGLGLSILYNLVTEALRGRVELVSAVGKGTRFILDLPLNPYP